MKALTIHQAVALRDHSKIDELIAEGRHPLSIIEFCIEMRGDAIDTLMMHVPHSPANDAFIERVIRHLVYIARYLHARSVLQTWLDEGTHELPNSPITQLSQTCE